MSRTPTMAEVLREAIDAALEDVHTAIPGVVTRYDASRQQADVKPLVKFAYLDESGERVPAPLPVVRNCPVQFPGGGGFVVTFPVAVGDVGLIIFSEASLDKWLAGSGDEVDPDFDYRHGLSDGIFVPGVRAGGAARSTAPADHVAVGVDGGSFQGVGLGRDIRIKMTEVITAINALLPGAVAPITDPLAFESQTVKVTP